jgi:hypothetical protein
MAKANLPAQINSLIEIVLSFVRKTNNDVGGEIEIGVTVSQFLTIALKLSTV